MKKKLFLTIIAIVSSLLFANSQNIVNKSIIADTIDNSNNFYDNVETYSLSVKQLQITGEIDNPGSVDFSKLTKHSVIVKEATLNSNGNPTFTGAFRYDGYSLFDILNYAKLNKANKNDFKPIIDLFVEIENEKGEKVIFSWGELYYPNKLHNIIIASDVARIVPSKTKDLWTLPLNSKIIVENDLITERNIENPTKITIKSWAKSIPTVKGMSPMYANELKIYNQNKQLISIKELPKNIQQITYHTIFYGRGRGIHSTTPFTGIPLKSFLQNFCKTSKENIKTGYFVCAGKDGYRAVLTYSELFNRNDQQEFLLFQTKKDEDGGLFSMFPAADFFSDRAIKSFSEIYFENIK